MGVDRITVTVDADLEGLVPGYLEKRRSDADTIMSTLAAGDLKAIGEIGHKMKGTGASYGFAGITDIGRRLEEAGKKGEGDKVPPLVAELRAYLDRVDIVYAEPPPPI